MPHDHSKAWCAAGMGPPTHRPALAPNLLESALRLDDVSAGGAFAKASVSRVAAELLPVQQNAWTTFAEALAMGRASRVVSIGGSMLAGANCNDSVSVAFTADCAYPRRFARSLSRHHTPVSFASLAAGGTTTEAMLTSLPMHLSQLGADDDADASQSPSLFVIDHSINDMEDVKTALPGSKRAQRLEASLESMLRFLLAKHSQHALLLVETYPAQTPSNCTCSQAYERVAARYGVPLVRYARVARTDADAFWSPNCSTAHAPTTTLSCGVGSKAHCLGACTFGNCLTHPLWRTHQLVADVLYGSFEALARQLICNGGGTAMEVIRPLEVSLPTPLASAQALRATAVCEVPRTAYYATRPNMMNTTPPKMTGWELREDRKGKPGWITTGPGGTSIEFDIVFGARPRLIFSYLRGYSEDLGGVKLTMDNRKDSRTGEWIGQQQRVNKHAPEVSLSARRDDEVRVTQTAVLSMDASAMNIQDDREAAHVWPGVMGFDMPPYSRGTLHVTNALCNPSTGERCKFKILSVVSC